MLGVTKKADKGELKKAFLVKVKMHHPDLSGSDSNEFNKLKEAYDILIDDNKRYQYDLEKGYLNALDIDDMEIKLKEFGSRYCSEQVRNLRNFDLHLSSLSEDASPMKKTLMEKIKLENVFSSPLFDLRLKFVASLLGGYVVTYNTLIWIMEAYIYPTDVHDIKPYK